MDDDLNSLASAFDTSPLTLDVGTLDSGFDATSVGTSAPTTSAPTTSQAQAPAVAQVSGVQNVLTTLTGLFNGGVAAYNDVATQTGLPLANGTPTAVAASVASPIIFAGLTQTQLLLVGGGILLVAVLFMTKRK